MRMLIGALGGSAAAQGGGGGGPALYDNSVAASGLGAITTLESAAFAVGGTNRHLLIFVGSSAGSPVAPSAVRWGGAGGALATQKGSTVTLGPGRFSVWELAAPAAQSSTVHVTWPSAQDERFFVAISLKDVNQSTPTGAMASANGTGTAPTVAATTTADDLVVDGVMFTDSNGNNLTITTGAGQTSRQEIEGATIGFDGMGVSTELATGSSTTMSWTISGTPLDGWAIAAIPVKKL